MLPRSQIEASGVTGSWYIYSLCHRDINNYHDNYYCPNLQYIAPVVALICIIGGILQGCMMLSTKIKFNNKIIKTEYSYNVTIIIINAYLIFAHPLYRGGQMGAKEPIVALPGFLVALG